jgi:hypothetical protein
MEQYYIRHEHEQRRGTECIRTHTSGGGGNHDIRGNEDGLKKKNAYAVEF